MFGIQAPLHTSIVGCNATQACPCACWLAGKYHSVLSNTQYVAELVDIKMLMLMQHTGVALPRPLHDLPLGSWGTSCQFCSEQQFHQMKCSAHSAIVVASVPFFAVYAAAEAVG